MENDIAVTVFCTAYNHENFIRKTLAGFVMQKTNFKFEVIVHDDASTDNTAKIIKEYVEIYPDIIKPIYQSQNQYSKKIHINQDIILPRAKGRYIAFCEGDDYWTDKNKLQEQYDIMEANPDLSICVHKVQCVYADFTIDQKVFPGKQCNLNFDMKLTQSQLADILFTKELYPFQTSSYFLKKEVFSTKERAELLAVIGDSDLTILFSSLLFGSAFYLNKVMSSYTTMSEGSYNQRFLEKSKNERGDICFLILNSYILMDKLSKGQYHDKINTHITKFYFHSMIPTWGIRKTKPFLKEHINQNGTMYLKKSEKFTYFLVIYFTGLYKCYFILREFYRLAKRKIRFILKKGYRFTLNSYRKIYRLFNPIYKNRKELCLANKRIIEANQNNIETAFSLLNDEWSKNLFRNYLYTRKTMKNHIPKTYIQPNAIQYYDEDIIHLSQKEIFLDCGAYNGETTRTFLCKDKGADYKSVLFEPDPKMFAIMTENMKFINTGNLEFFNAGVSDQSGILKFTSISQGSSHIDENGSEFITTIALDEQISETTFIKMDIEGHEMKALRGAEKLIKNCKPKLAICIYHKLEDLWEIPLYIHKLNPDYKLYLRMYQGAAGYYLNELVCYAII